MVWLINKKHIISAIMLTSEINKTAAYILSITIYFTNGYRFQWFQLLPSFRQNDG